MAEIEIKRTNFFDGQFLRQGEFLDLDVYHLHMRRRWGFVLFNQSGVVQAAASDLTIEVPNPAQTTLRVRAGMAIGKRPDLAEAKEIVLREDTQPIDLAVASGNVPTPLQAGDTGIVTVHYVEEPVAQPPSEGDVPGDTRVREHARITVHRNALPGLNAANGEPFVRLGDVTFNSMAITTALRQTAFLQGALIAPTPQISLDQNTVPATGTVNITVNSSGGLNLSGANLGSVVIFPITGITNVSVSNQLASSMTLSFTLTNAPVGLRTVTITTNASASATFAVQAVTPAPTITSLPATATRNQLMTIVGTNFIAPVTVTFTGGAVAGPNFGGAGESQTTTQIVLVVPGLNASTGPITITAAGGTTPPSPILIVL